MLRLDSFTGSPMNLMYKMELESVVYFYIKLQHNINPTVRVFDKG